MAHIGYFLSSEEHGPNALLEQAQLAEAHGIDSVWISDHFHPWLDEQGNSPFVWGGDRRHRRHHVAARSPRR